MMFSLIRYEFKHVVINKQKEERRMVVSRGKWILILFAVSSLIFSCAYQARAEVLMVDDFNSAQKPNKLGGDFGAWNADPNDTTQGCVDSFDSKNAYGGKGYALRLDYDVDSPNPAYNGFWEKLVVVNLKCYTKISFYVKGDKESGYTTKFKIDLKNSKEAGKYVVDGIDSSWKKIEIPLKESTGINDLSSMQEFVIVFDDTTVTRKVGTIYIDDLCFE